LLKTNAAQMINRRVPQTISRYFSSNFGEEEDVDVTPFNSQGAACNHNIKIPVDDKNLAKIFTQNEAWRQQVLSEDPEFFKRLGAAHNPRSV
jgi:hypothetical protein